MYFKKQAVESSVTKTPCFLVISLGSNNGTTLRLGCAQII